MGDMNSALYLTGVPVAAASAVRGYIASPKEVYEEVSEEVSNR
jgi:homoaconitase/3-isopropylmalate dehydratase large subunit